MRKQIKVDSVEILERGSGITVHVWSVEGEDFFEKRLAPDSSLVKKVKEIKEGNTVEVEYEEKEYMGQKLLKLKDILK